MARPIDRTAVDRLVVEHVPAALRLALRLAGNEATAEDMVQEALCRVLDRWRSFRGESSFKTWMLQIVVNVDRDRRRRGIKPASGGEAVAEAVARTAGPVELAAAGELHAAMRAAMEVLPQRQREVALLTWGEGLSPGDVAAVLGISAANVYTTIHLARSRIAQAIGLEHAGRDPS